MKRLFALLIVVLVAAACSTTAPVKDLDDGQDFYVRHVLYLISEDGEKVVEADPSNEMWLGKSNLAYITPGWTLILKEKKDTLIFINHRERSYVETPLPLNVGSVLSDELLARMKKYKSNGTVEVTGQTKEIMGEICKGYRVHSWTENDGKKYKEHKFMVWGNADYPVNLNLHVRFLKNLRKIYNRSESYREHLLKIEGIQMGLESIMKKGSGWEEVVVEVERRVPRKGIYNVPEGYTRKERIAARDLK